MKESSQYCSKPSIAPEPVDDATLLECVHAGGPDWKSACAILLERYRGPVYRRCLQQLGNIHDAEDALQGTLMKALLGLHRFEGRSGVRTWLFAIADNECCSLVRRRNRSQRAEHLQSLIRIHEEHQRRRVKTDEEKVQLVHKTLKQLPPKAREVLGLRFFGDASLDEIARTLDISLSAAKMRLYRALDLFEANYPHAGTGDLLRFLNGDDIPDIGNRYRSLQHG